MCVHVLVCVFVYVCMVKFGGRSMYVHTYMLQAVEKCFLSLAHTHTYNNFL